MVALHRDLIALRRTDETLMAANRNRTCDGSVISASAFFIRFFASADYAVLQENPGDDFRAWRSDISVLG